MPRAASWAQKGSSGAISSSPTTIATPITSASRQSRRPGTTRQPKPVSTSFNESRLKTNLDRRAAPTTSRPSTPAADPIRSEVLHSATMKQKEVPRSNSPALSLTTSDPGSLPAEPVVDANTIDSADLSFHASSTSKVDLNGIGGPPGLPNPPGLSAPPGLLPRLPVPPGLPAPPGISFQSRPLRSETDSPQTPLLASQTAYQMSTAARALVEDVKARRGSSISLSSPSPFPDFDRTLRTLSGDDGGFSFNLDRNLADQINDTEELPEFALSSNIPFRGSFVDAFPALRVVSPQVHSPSLTQSNGPSHSIYDPSTPLRPGGHYLEKSTSRGSSYVGSFNPFSDSMNESIVPSAPQHSQYSPVDEERKVSRFGFARGRQSSTAASSPLQSVSPIVDHHPFHQNTDNIPPHIIQSWQQGHDPSLTLSHGQAIQVHPLPLQPGQLPSINSELSEAQLRNFILSSQERANGFRHTGGKLCIDHYSFRIHLA